MQQGPASAKFASRARLTAALLLFGTVMVLAGYWMIRTPLIRGGWRTGDLNDYTLNLLHSQTVDRTGVYPFGFTYPPPSVIFRLWLNRFGLIPGSVAWLILEAAGMAAVLGFVMRRSVSGTTASWNEQDWWAASAAAIALKVAWEFEFKYINGNFLFLLFVLLFLAFEHRGSRWAAGVFLAASIAFKLYSAVFLPVLLFQRRFSTAGWCALWLTVCFVAAPAVFWRPEKAFHIWQSWLESLHQTNQVEFSWLFEAYLVSLPKAIGDAGDWWGSELTHGAAWTIGKWTAAVWLVGSGLLFRWLRPRTVTAGIGVYDAAFLLTWPLPASPQLQPHHLVCLLPAAMLAAKVVLDARRSTGQRCLTAALLLGVWLLLEWPLHRHLRGVSCLGAILCVQTTLILTPLQSPIHRRP